jgi:gentisate 1,2-dioxygenase
MQQIPAGSRSGRQRHSGNAVFYVQEGRGHTVLDGVTYQWSAGDMVLLPNRPKGVVFQHFNDDTSAPAYLVSAEPNLMQTIDLDRGAGFEQLETCPEYRAPGASANGKSQT